METTSIVMDTGTTQLVYQLAALFISGLLGLASMWLKSWIKTSEYVKKYNLDNEVLERTLNNAVAYAEHYAKKTAKEQISKREISIKYLDSVDPTIVKKYGDKLELMLDRKVEQYKTNK